jgi:hypothetical protein
MHLESVREIAGLPNCRILTLERMPRLKSLANLASKPTITSHHCPSL